jgi:putative flippase GtrA
MDGLESIRLPQGAAAERGKLKVLIQEALAYTAVSAFALLVDIAILWLQVRYFALSYLLAATVSFSAGLVIGYALSVKFVFKYRRLNDRPLELASFATIGVIGLAINAGAMVLGVRYLGAQYLVAKCGAASLTFIWNYSARRQLLFVRRRAAI